ncbi:hypothetical protein FACS1894176_11390 [Bacteroidia bacterium]|nr:hypothetical protein FACS1894176_11390 [Bacteroidia bacterium]
MEEFKEIANELFSAAERFNNNQCSYDKALKDIAEVIRKDFNRRRDERFTTLLTILGNVRKEFQQNEKTGIYECLLNDANIKILDKYLEETE